VVNESLAEETGKPLSGPVIERAFHEIELSPDLLTGQLEQMARDAVTAGVAAKAPDLKDFTDSSTRVRSG